MMCDEASQMVGWRASRSDTFKQQNTVYDQTLWTIHIGRLRQAVHESRAFGRLVTTHHRLAQESREEAERYLMASTLMVNLMPHGMYTNNWAAEPCPHHLNCFACGSDDTPNKGICELLVVDPEDEAQVEEVRRIHREASAILEVIPESSSPSISTISGFGRTRSGYLRPSRSVQRSA
jgi:hypothetical protein